MTPPTLLAVDNFLPDPDAVRARALKAEYRQQGSAGKRSLEQYLDVIPKETFERLLGIEITVWTRHEMNGRFQFCTARDPVVCHSDAQRWAATLFLSPDPPAESGLRLLRSRVNGQTHCPADEEEAARMYGDHYDTTLWDVLDFVGNRYNRLVIWDAQHAHAAGYYFGTDIENSRLFQVFFFDGVPV